MLKKQEGDEKGIEKVIKEVKRGNCTIVFTEQINTAEEDYIKNLHKLVARLLLEEYHEKKRATT